MEINVRNTNVVGLIESDDGLMLTVHFSEWWNGKGLDFTFLNERRKFISLSLEEMEAMVVAMRMAGMIDLKRIKKICEEAKEKIEKKNAETLRLQQGVVVKRNEPQDPF